MNTSGGKLKRQEVARNIVFHSSEMYQSNPLERRKSNKEIRPIKIFWKVKPEYKEKYSFIIVCRGKILITVKCAFWVSWAYDILFKTGTVSSRTSHSILSSFQQALILLTLNSSGYEQPQSERENTSNIARVLIHQLQPHLLRTYNVSERMLNDLLVFSQ